MQRSLDVPHMHVRVQTHLNLPLDKLLLIPSSQKLIEEQHERTRRVIALVVRNGRQHSLSGIHGHCILWVMENRIIDAPP